MVTCAWWLFKVLFMDLEDIELFLEGLPWGAGREAPSLQTHRGKLEAYIVSMYVATMTLTTVGYGDISADNTPERIGYILLFISGAFIWGNLLATIDEIHSSATAREKVFFCASRKNRTQMVVCESDSRAEAIIRIPETPFCRAPARREKSC